MTQKIYASFHFKKKHTTQKKLYKKMWTSELLISENCWLIITQSLLRNLVNI